MKKIRVLLIAVFLISAGSYSQQVIAQEKTKAEKEKEQKLQQVIEEQKKALTDQKKKMDVLVKEGLITEEDGQMEIMKQQEKMNDLMMDLEISLDDLGNDAGRSNAVRIYNQRSSREYEPYVITSPGTGYFFGHSVGSDAERTTWDFSKSVKESSFSNSYSFNVEKTVKNVVMSINGDCKEGEIRIKIAMPNGKNYSDIVIDEFGNLNWRKSFTISETENQDKTGEWKFQIISTKATGYFKISLQTY